MNAPNAHEFDDPISDWLEWSKAGDPQAFERLWRLYYARLIGVARSTIARNPIGMADENDVVQSALTSFYFRATEGKYPDLRDRTGLWKLLLTITLCKTRAMLRKEHNRRQNLQRASSQLSLEHGELSPEFAAEWTDQFTHLLGQLTDPMLRRVAIAKLEGFRNDEIAEQVGRSIPTVERKLHRIRELWSKQAGRS